VQADHLRRELGDGLLRRIDKRQPLVQHLQRLAGALRLLQQALAEAPSQPVEPLVDADLALLQPAREFGLRHREPLGDVGQPADLRRRLSTRTLAAQHCQYHHQRRQERERHQRRDEGPERPAG
jgi:hypothetical protein